MIIVESLHLVHAALVVDILCCSWISCLGLHRLGTILISAKIRSPWISLGVFCEGELSIISFRAGKNTTDLFVSTTSSADNDVTSTTSSRRRVRFWTAREKHNRVLLLFWSLRSVRVSAVVRAVLAVCSLSGEWVL